MESFRNAVQLLPEGLRNAAFRLSEAQQRTAEEIRLRHGQFFQICLSSGDALPEQTKLITDKDITDTFTQATKGSTHAALEQMRCGFVMLEGGHRLGLAGQAVVKDGAIVSLKDISSLCIRIAREKRNVSSGTLERLFVSGELCNTLILSPPGYGKTTLLRDLLCKLSETMTVSLADERGEVSGCFGGKPTLKVGANTDVLQGASKAIALPLLLRSMSPKVLATDEIASQEDVEAIMNCMGCGVKIIATAHGGSMEDIFNRPMYKPLERIFKKIITIHKAQGERTYMVTDLC